MEPYTDSTTTTESTTNEPNRMPAPNPNNNHKSPSINRRVSSMLRRRKCGGDSSSSSVVEGGERKSQIFRTKSSPCQYSDVYDDLEGNGGEVANLATRSAPSPRQNSSRGAAAGGFRGRGVVGNNEKNHERDHLVSYDDDYVQQKRQWNDVGNGGGGYEDNGAPSRLVVGAINAADMIHEKVPVILNRIDRFRKNALRGDNKPGVCEPPLISGNPLGEYALANFCDDDDDEEEDDDDDARMGGTQRDEIGELKERIKELESYIDFLKESRTREEHGNDSSAANSGESEQDSEEEEEGSDVASTNSTDDKSPPTANIIEMDKDVLLLDFDDKNNEPCSPSSSADPGVDVNGLNTSLIDLTFDEEGGNGKQQLEHASSNPLLDLDYVVETNETQQGQSSNLLSSQRSEKHECSDLTPDQVTRYSRQLLLSDGFGVPGQQKLLSSSVLIIGAGGIGSTVLLYLAASGVGKIGVADFDQVEVSNLHRQIIHSDKKSGMNKAVSAMKAMKELNPTINCVPIEEELSHENALDLVSGYDCVVDASDNPRTRYLINDACVLANKPLVSGSAMGTEGQLTVYNHLGGPCYRCLYPKVSPTDGCKSCSDNGVLGPVPGLIGILQATEVLKIITGIGQTMHDRLVMYDSLRCSFLSIKKPPAKKNCTVCGTDATIKTMEDSFEETKFARGPNNSTAAVCHMPSSGAGSRKNDVLLPSELSISCAEYEAIRKSGTDHVLLDVRATQQYQICALRESINIPLEQLKEKLDNNEDLSLGQKPVYCVCRRGIFSTEATRIIAEAIENGSHAGIPLVRNISGGLTAWANEVDTTFPMY